MPVIELELFVMAPAERAFDLARSVDLHLRASAKTGERAVAGVTEGLMVLGDEVTWTARHLGFRRRLTSCITAYDRPLQFRDSMVEGPFAGFDHDHRFERVPGGCMMFDTFAFRTPWGPLGHCANALFLTKHMRAFLRHRNEVLKRVAESEEWRQFVEDAAVADDAP